MTPSLLVTLLAAFGAAGLGAIIGGVILFFLEDLKLKRKVAVEVFSYWATLCDRLDGFSLAVKEADGRSGNSSRSALKEFIEAIGADFGLSTKLAIAFGAESGEMAYMLKLHRMFRHAHSLLNSVEGSNWSDRGIVFDAFMENELRPAIFDFRDLLLQRTSISAYMMNLTSPLDRT